MNSSFRELREHKPGTRDFDPRSALKPPETRAERCASLYDAIRDMGRYEAAVEAERLRRGGENLLPGP